MVLLTEGYLLQQPNIGGSVVQLVTIPCRLVTIGLMLVPTLYTKKLGKN
jgi:hypothetical protein